MHLSPPVAWAAVRSKAVALLLLSFCLLLLPLWESVIVLCFVVRYFMSIPVLQSSWWGRESWLLCLICLPGVSWWLSGSSSRCHGVVCSLWLWYFLIIHTYYFWLGLGRGMMIKNVFIFPICIIQNVTIVAPKYSRTFMEIGNQIQNHKIETKMEAFDCI